MIGFKRCMGLFAATALAMGPSGIAAAPARTKPPTTAAGRGDGPVTGVLVPQAGRVAASAHKWQDGAIATESEGGIWPDNTYFHWSFNKEFSAANTIGKDSTPFTVMALAHNTGSPGNVVALGADTVVHKDQGVGFGANIIVRTEAGIRAPKLVGLEIDIEPSAGVTPSRDSIGMPINAFNSAIPGPAIQTGGVGGGTFANGIVLYGIAASGAGLAAGGGAPMNAVVDTAGCHCRTAAIIHGVGLQQGDAYGTGGAGHSPYVYGSEGNELVVRLGAEGALRVLAADGATSLFSIGPTGRIMVGDGPAVDCSGPPTAKFRVTNGIVTHC